MAELDRRLSTTDEKGTGTQTVETMAQLPRQPVDVKG